LLATAIFSDVELVKWVGAILVSGYMLIGYYHIKYNFRGEDNG
jgi:hypothetical protein